MNTPLEGVVKYKAMHVPCTSEQALAALHPNAMPSELFAELDAVRTQLHDAGLIGVTATGIGYGNISVRLSGNAFLISGTGTGASRVLGLHGYGLVLAFDADANTVVSAGPAQASSESMTHGTIYAARPDVQCVVHIHNATLFERLLAEHAPATPPSAAYGTPELSRAVAALLKTPEGFFVTAGHSEGIFAYGPNCHSVLLTLHNLTRSFL